MVIPASNRRRSRTSRRGFNLLEVTISTLLVGVLLVGSMQTVGALVRRHGVQAQEDIKGLLAHDLLSEVQQTNFEEPSETAAPIGPDNGETHGDRQSFDDVDDYHLWSESTIHERDGNALVAYSGYTRSVQVQYVHPTDLTPSISPTILKQITVTVTGPDGREFVLVALRGRHSRPQEVTPGLSSRYVRSIRVRLDVDGASSILHSGTGIPNQIAVEDTP